MVSDRTWMPRRLFRKAVQQGRSERRGESYSVLYVEPLSDARTPLADFVNSLLAGEVEACLIAKMFARPWGGFKFPELLRHRFFLRAVKMSKVLGSCNSQDDAIPQDVVPSATSPVGRLSSLSSVPAA